MSGHGSNVEKTLIQLFELRNKLNSATKAEQDQEMQN
jgi:hypothetical protein